MADTITKKSTKYKATIAFGLNFEDKTPSMRVHKGDKISYDGETVIFSKDDKKVTGKASLNGAINLGWLVPQKGKSSDKKETKSTTIKNRSNYENKKGGDFDEFIKKTQNPNVISENDQIVKNLNDTKNEKNDKSDKHELAGDQVAVKDLTVTSSTVPPREKGHSTEVVQSDEYNSEGSRQIGSKEKNVEKTKKNSYTVDNRTPRISSDTTKDEVQRAKGVTQEEESQNAQVVGKVKRGSMKTQDVDGVSLKTAVGSGEKNIDASAKTGSGDKNINTSAKVSKGSESVSGMNSDAKVIGKIGEKKVAPKKATKKTAEKKSTSKKSTSKKSTSKKSASKKSASKKPASKKVISNSDSEDYLSMLPDDWGSMHWTQKEKYINDLEDKNFITFIMTVESINAIQNACKARLKELG